MGRVVPYISGLGGSAELLALVAAANRRRLSVLRSELARDAEPELAALVGDALAACRPGPGSNPALLSAAMQGAFHGHAQARAILDDARRAAALAPGSVARRRVEARLFAALAATPHLRQAAPRQVADAGFADRARALGERLLGAARLELPLALAAHLRHGVPGARFPLLLSESPDLACRPGEWPLGGTPWLLRAAPVRALELAFENGNLEVCRGRQRLLVAPLDGLGPKRGRGVELVERPRVAGSPSLRLGGRLVSTEKSLRVGDPVAGLEQRLGRSLALLGRAWLEAWREVHLFTELVVPLAEPGTVSYSLPTRPGVSYINVWGKSLIQLSDDLLHEAAHHKLHAVEALEPLVDDPGEALWWSPWREAWRPLRGIVHAVYTFCYGALLFAHLIASEDRALGPARLAFARARLLEEDASLAFSLADLERARRERRLAPAGAELVTEMAAIHARVVAPAARRAERRLARGGRHERLALERNASLRAELERRRGQRAGEA